MLKSRTLATLLVVGLSTVAAVAPAPAAVSSAPVRIMVNGDSLSQGFDGDTNWRYFLWKELQRQHLGVNMVGPFSRPHVTPGWSSASYADPAFDADHDALGGSTLGSWLSRIGRDVAQQQPDVLVVELGINDLRNGISPTTLMAELRQYVASAQRAHPTVAIVISAVLPVVDATRPGLDRAVLEYDGLVRQNAPSMSTADSTVGLSETTQGWSAATMTWDGIHPMPVGASLIARHIAGTLYDRHLVPGMGAPSIPTVRVWARNAKAQVRMTGRRALVTWDNETITSTRVLVQRVSATGTVRWHHVYAVRGGGPHARLRTRRLAKGEYQFRVSLTRKAMTSSYGPVTRARVGAAHRHRSG